MESPPAIGSPEGLFAGKPVSMTAQVDGFTPVRGYRGRPQVLSVFFFYPSVHYCSVRATQSPPPIQAARTSCDNSQFTRQIHHLPLVNGTVPRCTSLGATNSGFVFEPSGVWEEGKPPRLRGTASDHGCKGCAWRALIDRDRGGLCLTPHHPANEGEAWTGTDSANQLMERV